MIRPFSKGMQGQACPMETIFSELAAQLGELQQLRDEVGQTSRITEVTD